MISNILARIGIGGAKIDTKFENRIYFSGEIAKGRFDVTGGNIAQTIRQVDLLLCMKVKLREDFSLPSGDEIVILRSPNAARLEIEPFQKVQLPFEVKLVSLGCLLPQKYVRKQNLIGVKNAKHRF